MTSQQFHNPVMLKEVLENLAIRDGEIYVDGTFGAGGYSSAILQQADCKLIAFDRDISVEKFANKLQQKFGEKFVFKNKKFSQILEGLNEIGIDEIDGLVLDIGVSSMQTKLHNTSINNDDDFKFDLDKKASSNNKEEVKRAAEEEKSTQKTK